MIPSPTTRHGGLNFNGRLTKIEINQKIYWFDPLLRIVNIYLFYFSAAADSPTEGRLTRGYSMLDPPQRINLVLQLTFKIVLTICSRTIVHLIELQTLFSLATYMCPFEQSKNRNPKGPARAGPFGLLVDLDRPTVVA